MPDITSGLDPAEGRDDLGLPGADRDRSADIPRRTPDPSPSGEDERDELAARVGAGTPSPAGRDRPDVLPDVEPPDEQA